VYFKHLHFDGILALHVSNRHLDLIPVVYGLAKVLDIQAILLKKRNAPKTLSKDRERSTSQETRDFSSTLVC
jgi:hypothetical protein